MKRSAKLGLPCPHLHIVFVGRHGGRRVGPWVLGKEDFDDIIRVSLKTALGRDDFPLKSAGKVHRIKKDAEKYLSKYMSKGGDEVERWNRPEIAGGLRVHRWRHSSSALKARAVAHMPELHGNVAWWALGQAGWLEGLGIAEVTEWEADDFRPGGVRIQALRRDGIRLIWNMFRDLDPEWTGEESPYYPRRRAIADWGEWDYRRGPLRVSRNVAVNRGTDVVALLGRSIPSSYLESDDGPIKMGERISSPVVDVLKERFEHLYREVDVPEPVFLRPRNFRVENQLELPIELNAVGSSWDVGVPDSWDPYWDDPNWRGGPPRRVPG